MFTLAIVCTGKITDVSAQCCFVCRCTHQFRRRFGVTLVKCLTFLIWCSIASSRYYNISVLQCCGRWQLCTWLIQS